MTTAAALTKRVTLTLPVNPEKKDFTPHHVGKAFWISFPTQPGDGSIAKSRVVYFPEEVCSYRQEGDALLVECPLSLAKQAMLGSYCPADEALSGAPDKLEVPSARLTFLLSLPFREHTEVTWLELKELLSEQLDTMLQMILENQK